MKITVGIGITSYKDLSDPAVASAVYRAYEETAANIAPDRVDCYPLKFEVSSEAEFVDHWLTLNPFTVQDRRGGQIIERGFYRIGAQWRRRTSLRGTGFAEFRPETDWTRNDTIEIFHDYSAKIDWQKFFASLIEATEPAFAMLHLFASKSPEEGPSFTRMDRPVTGEHAFTSWQTPLGNWRKPDHHRLEDRRTYRFLPDLPWASFLGPQFAGQFDREQLRRDSAAFRSLEGGDYVQVTNQLSDVMEAPTQFHARQAELKQAFREGFFRN